MRKKRAIKLQCFNGHSLERFVYRNQPSFWTWLLVHVHLTGQVTRLKHDSKKALWTPWTQYCRCSSKRGLNTLEASWGTHDGNTPIKPTQPRKNQPQFRKAQPHQFLAGRHVRVGAQTIDQWSTLSRPFWHIFFYLFCASRRKEFVTRLSSGEVSIKDHQLQNSGESSVHLSSLIDLYSL